MPNPANEDATIRQRQLADELKRLRGDRTAAAVEELTGIKPSKLSRIESCHVRAQPRDVEQLTQAYGATAQQQEALIRAAEEAYSSSVMRDYIGYESWAAALRGHLELEADAERIDSFTIDLVPGLLQTQGYARALMEARPDVPPDTIPERLNFREQRQRRVRSQELQLWAVVSETVLYQDIGGSSTLAEQLESLADTGQNVTVQVLPFSAGAHPSLGTGFHIFRFANYPSIVYQETIRKALYQDDNATVSSHQHLMEQTRATALSPPESTTRLQQRAEELRT